MRALRACHRPARHRAAPHLRRAGGALLLALALISPAAGAEGSPPAQAGGEVAIEQSRWSGAVAPGARVRVKTLLGDLRVRRAGDDRTVEVIGTLQQFPGVKVEVVAAETAGGIDVAVELDGALAPEAPARADLVVFVPDVVALDAETAGGLLEAKGVRGDVALRSAAGEIRVLGVRGSVEASSVRGAIFTLFDPWVPGKTRTLTSLTGDVTIHLPEGAAASVMAATSGEISTDFSLEIVHRADREPTKVAKALIGGAEAARSPISIETRQGHVSLFRIQKVFQPAPGGAEDDDAPAAGASTTPPGADGEP